MAIRFTRKSEINIKKKNNNSNFSLRQYKLNQVQRDYLNSFQNTPKATAKLVYFNLNKVNVSKKCLDIESVSEFSFEVI